MDSYVCLDHGAMEILLGAGVSPHTWSYDFAETCVFGKESKARRRKKSKTLKSRGRKILGPSQRLNQSMAFCG